VTRETHQPVRGRSGGHIFRVGNLFRLHVPRSAPRRPLQPQATQSNHQKPLAAPRSSLLPPAAPSVVPQPCASYRLCFTGSHPPATVAENRRMRLVAASTPPATGASVCPACSQPVPSVCAQSLFSALPAAYFYWGCLERIPKQFSCCRNIFFLVTKKSLTGIKKICVKKKNPRQEKKMSLYQ